MPIATPDGPGGANNPLYGVMQSIMARYHADMEAQIDHTLADLAGRWQGVRASLLTTITRLERQMQAAVNAGDSITYTWLSQQARLLDLKAAVAGDIATYAAGARQIIGEGQTSAAETGLAAAQAKLDALTPPGVQYTWGVPPRSVLDQIAGATQPYSPLYALFEQMGPLAANNAAQALFQSVALGENPRAAARRLVWATDMSARRAEVIARTEIHRAWRQAQFANYRANSDVVQQWMWSADFASERTCGACIALDGSIHPLDEELADHVCGRCDAIPVTRPWSDILAGTGIPDDELAALDEGDASTWMDYRESGGEWLARQSAATQNRIMGPAKAEAYRQGAFDLKDLVAIKHDPTWGTSIEEKSLRSMGLDARRWLAEARGNGTASLLEEEAAASAVPTGMGEAAQATQTLAGSANDAAVSPVWQQIADRLQGQETPPEILTAPQVTLEEGAVDKIQAVFRRPLSEEELARITGASNGDVLTIYPDGEHRDGIYYEVAMANGGKGGGVFYRKGGQVILEYDTVFVPMEARGATSGGDIIEAMEAMRDVGVTRIETYAGGSAVERWGANASADALNGYYTWARLGFTGNIPDDVLAAARAQFGTRVKTIQDIMTQKGGAAWWKMNGSGFNATFDFRAGSYSRSVLDPMLARLLLRRMR